MNSMPLMPGIFRSVTMQSNVSPCEQSAGPRRRWSSRPPRGPACRSTSAIDSRAWRWSSTTSTRPARSDDARWQWASVHRTDSPGGRIAAATQAPQRRGGIRSVKAAPPPGQLAAVTLPPWTSAIRETIASPKPGAARLGREERLEDPRQTSSGRPGPLSATSRFDALRRRRRR